MARIGIAFDIQCHEKNQGMDNSTVLRKTRRLHKDEGHIVRKS